MLVRIELFLFYFDFKLIKCVTKMRGCVVRQFDAVHVSELPEQHTDTEPIVSSGFDYFSNISEVAEPQGPHIHIV